MTPRELLTKFKNRIRAACEMARAKFTIAIQIEWVGIYGSNLEGVVNLLFESI